MHYQKNYFTSEICFPAIKKPLRKKWWTRKLHSPHPALSLVPDGVKTMGFQSFNGQPRLEAERFGSKHQGLGAQLESNRSLAVTLRMLLSHTEPQLLPYMTARKCCHAVVKTIESEARPSHISAAAPSGCVLCQVLTTLHSSSLIYKEVKYQYLPHRVVVIKIQ